ncbi:anti-sigma factor [Dyadobacter tibetensis]|uniref:anti-sigma factor n=1 Tax=Dyadobacter tibetensis TaxID=1211851 RepID=UPI00047100B6|nr:anti-sigma factor [Dyadobacter tibetensis]
MNIEAYIASGIIEEYVLGTVSVQEKQEVECMSHIYPEIKTELLRVEKAMEAYAMKYQMAPPPALKDAIFAQMEFDEKTTEDSEGKVIPLDKGHVSGQEEVKRKKSLPVWPKFMTAAALILAVLTGWMAYQLAELKEANGDMAERMHQIDADLDYNSNLAQLYRDPTYKVIRLSGVERSPESAAAAFWNPKTNEVMLDVQRLPAVPEGKQYQLWSIVDGVPVDIGVVDSHFDGKVLKMKPTKTGAAAFAITLEREGGSPTPTMDQMYVMGKV